MSLRLIVVSAPSGAGKTTLCDRLLREFPELTLSISSTTRSPRGRERHGVEYFFLEKVDFERQIAEHRFAEWALVHDNYYGTSKAVIEKAFSEGKSVLLDIDVQGAESLRKAYPREAALFFISPPSLGELERRLRGRRTDSEESIRKRLANARTEMERISQFDHVIINDSFERAYAELRDKVREALRNAPSGGALG
ncbi:MAG: guanylate kinase [Oligoflexia bacterium]|nr:guanylate kinase [Oligoflexia bacterium]